MEILELSRPSTDCRDVELLHPHIIRHSKQGRPQIRAESGGRNGRLPKCWAEFPKLQLLDRDACNTTLRERLESLTFENLRAIASQLTSSLNSGIPRGSCGLNRIARLLGTEDSEGL